MRAWGTVLDGAPAWFQIGVMFNGSEAFGVRFDATTDDVFFIDAELVVKAIGGSGEIIGGISATKIDPTDSIGGEGCASAGTSGTISTNSNITLALGGYFSGAGGEMVLHGVVFEIA
jgi:hypothetical protein